MSWIKENKFVAGLGGATLVGAAVLIGAGVVGLNKTASQKAIFDAASEEASRFEKSPLYPRDENFNGKQKALAEYRKQTEELQAAFEKYRPQPAEKISSQEFTTHLKAAEGEVRNAFVTAKTRLPDGFYLGFENYTGTLAKDAATGILDYQLGAVKEIMLSLAAAAPSELLNVHRPKLEEEEGKEFKAADGAVARFLPLEITFQGSEKSMRTFLTSLGKNTDKFVVIRNVRIANQKLTAPMTTDAKFAEPVDAAISPESAPGFTLPGDTGAAAPAAAAPAADSSQILAQVLGSEEVQVFLRLDVLQFLPAKELPKP